MLARLGDRERQIIVHHQDPPPAFRRALFFDHADLDGIGLHRYRNQERLDRDRAVGERVLELLVEDALVRRVHVDDHEAARILREHVDAVDLA